MSENTSPEAPQSPDAAQPEAQRNWVLKIAEGAAIGSSAGTVAAKAASDAYDAAKQGVKQVIKTAADKIHGHGAKPADTGGAAEGKPDAGETS